MVFFRSYFSIATIFLLFFSSTYMYQLLATFYFEFHIFQRTFLDDLRLFQGTFLCKLQLFQTTFSKINHIFQTTSKKEHITSMYSCINYSSIKIGLVHAHEPFFSKILQRISSPSTRSISI